MSSALDRYNIANQSYSSSISGIDEFQRGYNQNYQENIIEETQAYKQAKQKRADYIALAKEKATSQALQKLGAERELGGQITEGSLAVLTGIETGKAIIKKGKALRERFKSGKKSNDLKENDPQGDGGAENEEGIGEVEAENTEGRVQSSQDIETTPEPKGGEIEMTEIKSTEPPSLEETSIKPVSQSNDPFGDMGEVSDSRGLDIPEGADYTQRGLTDREHQNLESTNEENLSRETSYKSELAETGEEGGEVAGEVGGEVAGEVGAEVGAEATTSALSTAGEIAGTVAEAIPVVGEVGALVGIGVGLYEAFHHHHAKVQPPDLTQAPPPPKPPQLLQQAQGSTRDIRNTRAEFTTPSYDSVTNMSGSVTAF